MPWRVSPWEPAGWWLPAGEAEGLGPEESGPGHGSELRGFIWSQKILGCLPQGGRPRRAGLPPHHFFLGSLQATTYLWATLRGGE